MKRHRGQRRRKQAEARTADHTYTRPDGLHSGGGRYRRQSGGVKRRTRNGRCGQCGRRDELTMHPTWGLWMCPACDDEANRWGRR